MFDPQTGLPISGQSPSVNALQNQLATIMQNVQNMNQAKGLMATNQQVQKTVEYVNGIEGAKKYLETMAPNSSATPFDAHNPIFYVLSKDANGVPAQIQVSDPFTIHLYEEPKPDVITRKDLEDFKADIQKMLDSQRKPQFQQGKQPNSGKGNEQ